MNYMKIFKYWILGIAVAFLNLVSMAQSNNELVTTIMSVGGVTNKIVNEDTYFRIKVAFSYNTSQYTNYSIKMVLPEGITWPQPEITADENSISVNTSDISVSGSEYTIPFTPLELGSKSTNFFLEFLYNDTEDNCLDVTLSEIPFTLQGHQGNTITPIRTHVSELITPKGSDSPGSVSLYLFQGNELNQNHTNTGAFPYYVDVKIITSNLSTLPEVTLTYPSSKLTYINAVFYNNGTRDYSNPVDPPFHKDILGSGSLTHTSGLFTFNQNTFNNADYIRIYFRPTSTGQLTAGEIKLEANGAKYKKCDLSEVPLTVTPVSLSNFQVVTAIPTLYPSIQHRNDSLVFCAQNCNFNVGSIQATYHFEINSIYTQFPASIPRVRIDCPTGTASINKLTFVPAQHASPSPAPVFKYRINGSSTEHDASVSTSGEVTFPLGNPQVIFVQTYASQSASYVAKDFKIHYTSFYSNLTSFPVASKVFTIQYENFVNSKTYTSGPIWIKPNCVPGLSFRDDYENLQNGLFQDNVSYLPGAHANVLITIRPHQHLYSANYTISGLIYELDPNMILDPDNRHILFSESGVPGSFKPIKAQGDHYKNMDIRLVGQRSLEIVNAELDNTVDCGEDKPLYLMIGVMVKGNTSYVVGGYRSKLIGNTTSFVNPHFSTWNVIRSIIDKLSSEVKVICPGDRQEMSEFEKGQTVTVQYILNNENQNPVKTLEYAIPVIQYGTLISTAANGGITIRSKNQTGILNEAFLISADPNNISIKSKDHYVLNGNDKLYIDIQYKLDESLASGISINDILYYINSYESIDNSPGSDVKLLILKQIKIVDQSLCIPQPPCEECVTSFSPMRDQEYLLSAWIKESYNGSTNPAPRTYVNSGILITFNDGDIANLPLFRPSGPIIDGWQRVEASFVVPSNAHNIHIEMVNNGDNPAFFDDIRIHPFRSNMKSFVYDPSTQRLVAELDENNYATQYEYDDEGILIRVKKETERGMMTIKESRSNQSKIK